MTNTANSQWSEIPPYALWLFGLAAMGWVIGPLLGYYLAQRSQRVAREFAAKDAAQNRIRDFLGLVAEIKAQIATSGDPEFWVVFFVDTAAPELKAGFDKIARDLSGGERIKLRQRVDAVLAFSAMRAADIYPQQKELLAAIESIEAHLN